MNTDTQTRTRRSLLGAAAVAAALAFTSAAIAQSGGHEYTVAINNMSFDPTPSNLKVGDTILWVNRDTVLHSVTARDHSFDLRLNPGKSERLTLQKAGRIPFDCLFHSTMRGVLVVADK